MEMLKNNGKLSLRKVTAFIALATAITVTFTKVPPEYQIHALYAWIGLALLCLGIVTTEEIIKFKNGSDTTKDKPAIN